MVARPRAVERWHRPRCSGGAKRGGICGMIAFRAGIAVGGGTAACSAAHKRVVRGLKMVADPSNQTVGGEKTGKTIGSTGHGVADCFTTNPATDVRGLLLRPTILNPVHRFATC